MSDHFDDKSGGQVRTVGIGSRQLVNIVRTSKQL